MSKNSKQKGNSYELKTAKTMTDWWGGGKFSRVPASGGLHWADDQRVAGDIIPPNKSDFPFVIECKKREGWTMDHVLLNTGQVKEWWAQVVGDARRVKLTPFLIFSRNRAKDFVMVPYDAEMYHKLSSLSVDVMLTTVEIKNIRDESQYFSVIVTTFDTFSRVPIEEVKEYAKSVSWDFYADAYKEEK